MNYKNFIKILGFNPKENATDIYIKKYQDTYSIEIDFNNALIDYGTKIKADSKTTQNFLQPENWVVLECVNRLLEKGYKPENIILEKTYPAGHGHSGRLDICVNREKSNDEYLLIECKTYGKEFEKEFNKLKKDGGQLFTYFKFSNKADLIMLYTSDLIGNSIEYKNEIIKIEEDYRTGDVKDFYEKWDKKTYRLGFWENETYNSEIKKIFTKKDLIELNEDASSKIFHEFASILRKHSVSDKPNAFNKIFNLFLAKLYDEAKGDDDELEFHWREEDNPVEFQVRLVNLHKEGLSAFLQKEIEGIYDSDFLTKNDEELLEKKKKVLKFNNILAIKEVLDDASFDENHRVLKDVVKLLEKYQIRYPRKQQHLSNFFEKLLTTGLKQEVGQYFTPPPITKFIVRSLPIKDMIMKEANSQVANLPALIDYAAGSGHFITEAMEEYQDIINSINIEKDIKYPIAKKEVASWKADPYNWAAKYVYGIEKDYRLAKVAKVGCYFYGDGVAQIIHGDGLDSFATSKTYKGLLKENNNLEDSTKAKFSFILSNPPYSVNDCKDDLEYIGAQNDFTLYPFLSDKSKDIECLFVERTKHLLKDDGIAAIILPSSILNNSGIQTKTREILLQYFDIIAIAELGSNTFMATGTKTVTLFLKRRNNQVTLNLKNYINKFYIDFLDNTINQIEEPIAKYINYVWDNISFEDYLSLLKKEPNNKIIEHEIYKEYRSKIKYKKESDFWDKLIEIEKDKLLYFLLAYNQRNIVLVKSGSKDAEKRFLGYEFSNRRGSEGMHSTQGGKTIDESTQLYNTNDNNDYTKASSYIYNAFLGNHNLKIAKNLEKNIFYVDLINMLNFDRAEFNKDLKLSIKKKVKIESKWELRKLDTFQNKIEFINGYAFKSSNLKSTKSINEEIEVLKIGNIEKEKFITNFESCEFHIIKGHESKLVNKGDLVIGLTGATVGKSGWVTQNSLLNQRVLAIRGDRFLMKYLSIFIFDNIFYKYAQTIAHGNAQGNLSPDQVKEFQIPLPPLNIQEKIVSEIEVLEFEENKANEEIKKRNDKIENLFNQAESNAKTVLRLSDENIFSVSIGKRVLKNEFIENGKIPVYSANVIEPFGKIDKLLIEDFSKPSILWGIDGDWMVNHLPEDYPFYPTDHCGVLRVLDNSINEKYLAFILEKEGKTIEFSRTKRASIDRIKGIKIAVPPIEEQEKIVEEIEKIELEIKNLYNELKEIPKLKEEILKNYL